MKVQIYTIEEEYIEYLRKFDSKIMKNKVQKRPYIGIVFQIENIKYFSPLSSPKEKHKTMKKRLDFIKIRDGQLGIINLNNSIPINGNVIKLIDINSLKNSKNLNDRKYGVLCEDQLIWCDNNFNSITKNFSKLYHLRIDNKLPNNILIRCCDFSLLEEKALEYKK